MVLALISQLKEWMPLVMEGRNRSERVAATSMAIGTDVNFGELTKICLITYLDGVTMHFQSEVQN
jgi:malate dehydrogenase (quinone)